MDYGPRLSESPETLRISDAPRGQREGLLESQDFRPLESLEPSIISASENLKLPVSSVS